MWGRQLWSVVISPFGEVTFLTSYVGDVLTSMVKVSVDVSYTFCWLYKGTWIPFTDAYDNDVDNAVLIRFEGVWRCNLLISI